MKSKKILVHSGNNASQWNVLLKNEKKRIFLEGIQKEAISLMNQDTKVHMKEIGNSSYQLLVYAGYADSRQSVINNNRDSNQQLSNPGSVI